MKVEEMLEFNKKTLSRIAKKHKKLKETNPIPYINTQVLIQGMVNASQIFAVSPPKNMTPSQVQMFFYSYHEALEGILDTVNEPQGPTTCVYITEDEQRKMLSTSKAGRTDESIKAGSPKHQGS